MDRHRLEELFYDALELDSVQRAAFLDELGAHDAELRRELETLLAHARSRTLTCLRVPQGYMTAGADALADPIIGERIDHYAIMREIDRGGMGTVYLARDTKLERPVALKLLHARAGTDARRFLREARVTARCRHENIVVVHDLGLHHESPYMVLEYLEGTSVRHEIRRLRASERRMSQPSSSPAMSIGRVVELMIPVLRALVCAHEQHVIHCDLKPENIVLTDSGIIKVLDFGIARAIADTVNLRNQAPAPAADGESRLLVGTPLYMSPEQWGAGTVDARSDIWAVGLMLYEMIAGRHPLMQWPPGELQERAIDLDRPVPSIGEAVAGLGALGGLVDDCLRKRKEERVPSASALLERLERAASSASQRASGERRGVATQSGHATGAGRAAAPASSEGTGVFVLEFFELDPEACTTFRRARVTGGMHGHDEEELEGYRRLLEAKTARGGHGERLEALRARLDRWIMCMPGELLCERRGETRDAPVMLLTIRNVSARQATLHTIEVELFERDPFSRGTWPATRTMVPTPPVTRLLTPLAEYGLEVREPRDSYPMIPNIVVAPDDVVSFRVKLDVAFSRYSLRVGVCGSYGSRVETGAIHVW